MGLQLEDESARMRSKVKGTPLDDEYAHRARTLWNELPRVVSDQLARAHMQDMHPSDPLAGDGAAAGGGDWRKSFEESAASDHVPLRLVSGT